MHKEVPICFLFAAIHQNPYLKPESVESEYEEDETYEDDETTNHFTKEEEYPPW